jgi:F-type H+-transporting ATPase subunit delta
MDIGIISVRYARALLKYSTDANVETRVYQEMMTLASSYVNVPDLRFTIDNPMCGNDKKQKLIETACGGDVCEVTKNFIKLVLKELRANFLQFMANSFIDLYRRQNNITRGKLITAATVSSDTKEKMKKMVESKTKGTVEFETEVNTDIIGGFILEYDTYRMDASVQTQLRSILSQLKQNN